MPSDAPESRTLETLGLLTRGALHEMANPLVALVGSAELALADTEPGTKLHDRVALTHRTGSEIAEIVRCLQAFIRTQAEPARPLSLGQAANTAVELVTTVLPTHGVTLSASGDATIVGSPGEVSSSLVVLLVQALRDREGALELTVREADGEAIVTATGGGEVRFPRSKGDS